MDKTGKKKQPASVQAAPGAKNGAAISDGSKGALFTILALLALGVLACVFLFPGPTDPSSPDGSDFYFALVGSNSVAIIYDVRKVESDPQQSAIYQCGVDMIYKGRFVGKSLSNIACEEGGCLYTTTGSNGSNRMSYDQAIKSMDGNPYILIKPGKEAGYAFFKRHMEIYIGVNASGTKCDISATES